MDNGHALHLIDVEYLGQRRWIAACALETDDGLVVIDPGPSTSLPGLATGLAGIGATLADVRALLLTHIHLDHAGAAGTLARDQPDLRVYVHARGAPHLIDPSRLLQSAYRIYGDRMADLFGEFLPVRADRITVLDADTTLDPGGRRIRVTHAPGHAWHHVAYLDEISGTLFAGDAAGERFPPATYVLPVTPPPDIDMAAWRATLAKLRAWQPASIFITHFGGFADAARHLDELDERLESWATRVRASLDAPGTDEDRAAAFVTDEETALRRSVGSDVVALYLSGGIRDSWYGLARYWRKRTG